MAADTLGPAGRRAVEPDARRDQLHLDRPVAVPADLDRAARAVPAVVYPRVHEMAGAVDLVGHLDVYAALAGALLRAAVGDPRAVLRALAGRLQHHVHVHGVAGVLRHRAGLSRRIG